MERIVFCEVGAQGWICGKEVCEEINIGNFVIEMTFFT